MLTPLPPSVEVKRSGPHRHLKKVTPSRSASPEWGPPGWAHRVDIPLTHYKFAGAQRKVNGNDGSQHQKDMLRIIILRRTQIE